jgi:hypothetical protein
MSRRIWRKLRKRMRKLLRKRKRESCREKLQSQNLRKYEKKWLRRKIIGYHHSLRKRNKVEEKGDGKKP